MRSKLTVIGLIAMLGIVIASFSGGLMAGEEEGKKCPHGSEMVEGKCCEGEMCTKIKEHKAALNAATEKMAEHLDAIREIQNDKEWRIEVEKHLVMVQKYIAQMSNCPMGDIWHAIEHGKAPGEEGSESK